MTTTSKTVADELIKAGIRRLISEEGRPVKPEVSKYGWSDGEAAAHIHPGVYERKQGEKGCGWVVPEGVKVSEKSYVQFDGTFTNDKSEIGLNAPGCHCQCGKYTDVTLRVTTSLGKAIQTIIGYDTTKEMVL